MIFFIRHAQAIGNNSGIVIGASDPPLTSEGEKDAKKMVNTLQEINPVSVFSSDLVRCQQTLDPWVKQSQVKIHFDPILREKHFGIYEGGTIKEYQSRTKMSLDDLWQFKPKGGESFFDVSLRIKQFVQSLEELAISSERNIVICSHATIIRTMISQLMDLNFKNQSKISIRNASISSLEMKKGIWAIHKLDDTSHLANL